MVLLTHLHDDLQFLLKCVDSLCRHLRDIENMTLVQRFVKYLTHLPSIFRSSSFPSSLSDSFCVHYYLLRTLIYPFIDDYMNLFNIDLVISDTLVRIFHFSLCSSCRIRHALVFYGLISRSFIALCTKFVALSYT